MTGRQASSLRVAVASHEPARGKRYPAELKARVVEFARARRSEGASWGEISADLGVAFETVRRWCLAAGARSSHALVPVHVVPERVERLVSVASPSGYRIEGLTLPDAVAALRELG